VLRVSRATGAATGKVHWEPERGALDPTALSNVDVVVHLAGESVDARWTPSHKRAIRASRVDGTSLLARTIATLRPAPRVLIAASAVGIYGDRGDEVLDEESSLGTGFLAEVGAEWERAAEPARAAGIRTVHARFGVVLSRKGGALARMVGPFELGAGGKLGTGTQWMSWVAIDDLAAAVLFAIDSPSVAGPMNVTAPNPVTNADFAKALGHALHRPAVATVPPFALRLLFGELADAALLASQRVLPRVLERAGFVFRYPTLDVALSHELTKMTKSDKPTR
jgi:uncharacterized protein (TIGR01777 family)